MKKIKHPIQGTISLEEPFYVQQDGLWGYLVVMEEEVYFFHIDEGKVQYTATNWAVIKDCPKCGSSYIDRTNEEYFCNDCYFKF